MALANCTSVSSGVTPSPVASIPARPPKLHKVAKIRKQQGLSLRSAARRMNLDVSKVRDLERESTDMPLSLLYRWQEALEVPIADLLVEQDEVLSGPILSRARMVRLMKTVAAIRESAEEESIQRMAQMMSEQLVELMPELAEVSPWHSVGQRRTRDEYGRIAEQPLPDDWFARAM